MRFYWIISLISILVCIALALIIYGQNKGLMMLNKGMEKLQMDSKVLDAQHAKGEHFKAAMGELVDQGKKTVEELEAALTKASPDMEKKKTENDACQAEKKTKSDELASIEKEHAETQATLKAESDAWSQEINTLKAKLAETSPICDHVKDNPLAQKLCAGKATTEAGAVQTTTTNETSKTK